MPNEKKSNMFSGIDRIIQGEPLVSSHVSYGRATIERAPNAIQFVESPKFLAGPNPIWPEQYNVLRDFHELLCPFCNDVERIQTQNDVPREKQVLFEYDRCPQCGITKTDIADTLHFYNAMIGVAGMRSGKSAVVAFDSAYVLHETLFIDKLPEKLGLIKVQTLDCTYAAAAGVQASETVYALFRGFYDESPWFQHYKDVLMWGEKHDPYLSKGDLYWETDTLLHFMEKRIRVKSITSNAATHAGLTRVFAVIDELSRLDAGESNRSANEVYRVLNNSLLTVRTAVTGLRKQGHYALPDGLMYCVSSPIYSEDKSMRLLNDAKQDTRMFPFKKATWEFNPTISKEDLSAEFKKDPIGAKRDFGADPPGAMQPFVPDITTVDRCVDFSRPSMFDLREEFFEKVVTSGGKNMSFHYVRVKILNIRYLNMRRYVMHCDPGESGDSFCLAIGHNENGVVYLDGAIEIRPVLDDKGAQSRAVHFPSVVNMILELSRIVHLEMISYDRWNSTDHIHQLIDAGLLAVGKNINRDDHIKFLGSMNDGLISFPKPERENVDPAFERNVPCAKALYELKRLNDNGSKVDHVPDGTNDMIQCYVGVHRLLVSPESVLPARRHAPRVSSRKPVNARVIKLRR